MTQRGELPSPDEASPDRLLLWPGDTIIIQRGYRLKLEATILRRDGDTLVCRHPNGREIRVLLPSTNTVRIGSGKTE